MFNNIVIAYELQLPTIGERDKISSLLPKTSFYLISTTYTFNFQYIKNLLFHYESFILQLNHIHIIGTI